MRRSIFLCSVLALGCGSSTPPVKSQPAAATSTATDASEPVAKKPVDTPKAEQEPKGVPGTCEGAAESCVMPTGFVKRMCAAVWPDLALALFAKSTPWRRAYVAVKQADAFNGFGGPSSEEKLVFEEEVLIIGERKPNTGGMSVSGVGASYDLLRWDGSCATLSAQEVTLRKPPKAGHAKVPWRSLDESTQGALFKDDRVTKVATERKKECKGATMGEVSAKCEKAERALNDLVVEAVRNGIAIPIPTHAP
jgi:hypothetical protein